MWDDSPEARAKAEAEGFACTDLTRNGALEGVAALVTSPGIPHLYPAPNKVIALALELGIPVDNDIGLFFQSFAGPDGMSLKPPPKWSASPAQWQIDHHGADPSYLSGCGPSTQMAGNIGKGLVDRPRPGR